MTRAIANEPNRSPLRRLGSGAPRLLVAGSLLLSVAATALPAAAQTDAAGPTTAQAVPADAAVFLSFDTDRESAQWRQAEELIGRLGWPNVFDDLEAELTKQEHFEGMEKGAPTREETEALLGGEFSVAVTSEALARFYNLVLDQSRMAAMMGGMDDSPAAMDDDDATAMDEFSEIYDASGLAAILEPSDPDVAWAYVARQFADLAEQTGADVEQSAQGEVEILSVQGGDGGATPVGRGEDEEDEDNEENGEGYGEKSMPKGIAAARAGDLIIAAATPEDLRPFVDAATGAAPSLAESDELSTVIAELPSPEGLFFLYANTAGVPDRLDPQVRAAIENLNARFLGGSGETWDSQAAVVAWADDNGFRFDTIQTYPADLDLSDLVPENADITVDEKVSADSVVFFGGYHTNAVWDAASIGIAQAIGGVMSGGMGTPVPVETALSEEYIDEQLAAAEQFLGFNLRDDFFGQFEGEYALAIGLPAFNAAGVDLGAVFATELADAAPVAESAREIARLIRDQVGAQTGGTTDVSTRRVDGDTIYVVRDESMQGTPALEFGVAQDRFFVGLGTGIDTFLDGPDAPLADNEQYQRVLATLPQEYYQVGYIDLKQIVGLITAFTGMGAGGIVDADPGCADFADQAEAQAAYDTDPMTNTMLDQDFDGQACEDFFAAAASPAASPVAAGGLENLEAFAAVAFQRDGKVGSSAIIYIAGGEE